MGVSKRAWGYCLICVFLITVTAGMVYTAEQQNLRLSANDPQIQMAEDTANALVGGKDVKSLVSKVQVDLADSLAPFVVVYDDSNQVLASSAVLNKHAPILPDGVLNYVAQHGTDRITWTPAHNVRIAAVIVKSGGAQPRFVLAGRSLREVEQRIGQVGQLIAFIWLLSVLFVLAITLGSIWVQRRN